MPIHDLGYRAWEGSLTAPSLRFYVVTDTGIRLAWNNRWLRRFVLVAWLPAAYLGIAFFLLEQALAHTSELRSVAEFLAFFPQSETVLKYVAAGDPQAARHDAWAWLLLSFLRYPQVFIMVLVVGMIAPPLIAKDVLSRGFLLYFSRPLVRSEYILGKLLVVGAFLVLIVTLPALLLYALGVLLSPPEIAVIGSTWDLPLRVLLASAVLVIPTTSLALAFSSLTTKTFYARFAWFATWFVGLASYLFLQRSMGYLLPDRWSLISLYHTLGRVQSWIFGLSFVPGQEATLADVLPSIALLTGITVVSTIVIFRQVSAPMRV